MIFFYFVLNADNFLNYAAFIFNPIENLVSDRETAAYVIILLRNIYIYLYPLSKKN